METVPHLESGESIQAGFPACLSVLSLLEGIDRGLTVGKRFDVHVEARGVETDLRVF